MTHTTLSEKCPNHQASSPIVADPGSPFVSTFLFISTGRNFYNSKQKPEFQATLLLSVVLVVYRRN